MTKFLSEASPESISHFLDTTVTKFLADNDISVTKFLDSQQEQVDKNDISVTKFLNEYVIANFLESATPH